MDFNQSGGDERFLFWVSLTAEVLFDHSVRFKPDPSGVDFSPHDSLCTPLHREESDGIKPGFTASTKTKHLKIKTTSVQHFNIYIYIRVENTALNSSELDQVFFFLMVSPMFRLHFRNDIPRLKSALRLEFKFKSCGLLSVCAFQVYVPIINL